MLLALLLARSTPSFGGRDRGLAPRRGGLVPRRSVREGRECGKRRRKKKRTTRRRSRFFLLRKEGRTNCCCRRRRNDSIENVAATAVLFALFSIPLRISREAPRRASPKGVDWRNSQGPSSASNGRRRKRLQREEEKKKSMELLSLFLSLFSSSLGLLIFFYPIAARAAVPSGAFLAQATVPEPCAGDLRSIRRKWARACWRPGPGAPIWRGPRPQPGRRPTTSDEQQGQQCELRRPWRGARRRPGWPSGTGRSASSSGGVDTASVGVRGLASRGEGRGVWIVNFCFSLDSLFLFFFFLNLHPCFFCSLTLVIIETSFFLVLFALSPQRRGSDPQKQSKARLSLLFL